MARLAEGGDRLLTKTALKKFGSSAGLEVPLPLPWDVYFQTFDKDYRKQLVDEFKLIARHAQRIIELPSRFGTLAEIGVVDRKPKLNFEPHPHEKQYQLANAYIAQSCDFLFAIWDCREIEQCNFELNGSWLQPGRGRDEASSVPSYSAHAKPGGVWEALNWWMNSNQIPDSMRFELGSRPRRHQLRNQRDLTSVLLLK